jgi:6,7-dimethyl-8-ribityllumazine synthase
MFSATVGLVKATWHAEAVDAFAISCSSELKNSNRLIQVNTYNVPGVVEIPLFTKKLIQSQTVDIVVVAGLIADHGVYRHDFVASTVMDATMKVQMETGVPIIYGILTPREFLSEGREEFFKKHFIKKGQEAARTVLATLDNEQLLAGLLKETG